MKDSRKAHWIFWGLTAFAALVLGAAAVWLGGINQDEGWYLYAANLVQEGQRLYRDFFYTQGPQMPKVYSSFTWVWANWGLLGARLFTLFLGILGIVAAAVTARMLVSKDKHDAATLMVVLLLGCNLYHLYYLAMPKTYALASLFVMLGFCSLVRSAQEARSRYRVIFAALAGWFLAEAAGTRISLGALLAVTGIDFLLRKRWSVLLGFCLGGFAGLAYCYLPSLLDAGAREGLIAAQKYHSARGGFDLVWSVGSFSRLVRWYLPVFIVLGLGIACRVGGVADERCKSINLFLWGFLAVFVVQMMAPFPYEDYQVPIMGLLAVYATVTLASSTASLSIFKLQPSTFNLLLVLGLSFATSFGSPLLEKWMTNGQDRFWSLKKDKCELAQLRDVARRIKALDPDGKILLTQDTYLAVETNRKVPKGLEMGPFSMLTDKEWQTLLGSVAPRECGLAVLSGYSFAVEPPKCNERPIEQQMDYWRLLKQNFKLVDREEAFGQNATTLLILKRK